MAADDWTMASLSVRSNVPVQAPVAPAIVGGLLTSTLLPPAVKVAVAPGPMLRLLRCCVEPKLVVLLAVTDRLRAAAEPALVLMLAVPAETVIAAPCAMNLCASDHQCARAELCDRTAGGIVKRTGECELASTIPDNLKVTRHNDGRLDGVCGVAVRIADLEDRGAAAGRLKR